MSRASLWPRIPDAEVTPRETFLRRRDFLKLGAAGAGAILLGSGEAGAAATPHGEKLAGVKPSALYTEKAVGEKPNSFEEITSYNNFYEFGTDKTDPKEHAHKLKTKPWTVTVEGEVKKPVTFDLDALLKGFPLEERTYRFRCVETWSMVVPWVGFPLAELIKRVEPTSRARYLAFTTVYRPEEMPGQRESLAIPYPYLEGLRMDEAMSPLTLLAVGLYGEVLPNQNGAPLRLVVPWKYGFKGIKSIVRISLLQNQPPTTWNLSARSEYGFYANVNPEVDHPRWSQARERRIGEFFRRKTLPFNGYAEQVASLYTGMDLAKNF